MMRMSHPSTQPVPRPSGMSLIELMVALAVSAILLLGVTTVYTGSKRSYVVTGEFAHLQENARFALNLLTRNIRMAGFTGCNNLKYMQVTNNIRSGNNTDSKFNFTVGNYLDGTATSNWSANWPDIPIPSDLIGTDAIRIKKGSICSAGLIGTMANTNSAVQIAGNLCDFQQGENILITDCETADIFRNTNNSASTLDNNTGLSRTYGPDAFTYKFEHIIYFIKKNPQDQPSLYQQIIDGGANLETELVPNVENMVVHYGEDTDNDNSVNEIRTSAAAVDKWENVINVYVRLLFRSEEVGTAKKPYTFNDQTVVAADSDTRYRKEFVTAINLRNRTP